MLSRFNREEEGSGKKSKECTEYIGIRVTPEEKKQITALTKAAGVTITGFLVGAAIGDKIGDVIVKEMEAKKRKK